MKYVLTCAFLYHILKTAFMSITESKRIIKAILLPMVYRR